MIILGTSLALILFAVVYSRFHYGSFWNELAGVVGGVVLFSATLVLPISHAVIRSEIITFHSTRATLEAARTGSTPLELAAITSRVVEANAWLARQQYWNGTLFDIWIPDEVDELKPIW